MTVLRHGSAESGTIEVFAPATARRQASTAQRFARFSFGLDAVLLTLAVVLSHLGARAAEEITGVSLGWSLLFPGLVLALLAFNGHYRPRLACQLLDDARRIVIGCAVATMTLITFEALLVAEGATAANALRPWVFATVFLLAGRAGLIWSEVQARRAGEVAAPTLIVGSGRLAETLFRRFAERPELGLRPVGLVDDSASASGDPGAPLVGSLTEIERLVEEHGIEHVVIAFGRASDDEILAVAERCRRAGVRMSLVPRLYETVTCRATFEHVGGVPLLSLDRCDPRGWQFALKDVVERLVAAALLVAAAPLLGAIALGVWVTSGRPILFRQVRVSRDGHRFEMLKFRSMRVAPASSGRLDEVTNGGTTAPGGVEGEDRRTAFGTFLRKTSLDELPQLVNVVRGDMALVGPRPERPEFVDAFAAAIHRYDQRHRVKTGITGWAQIHGLRGKTSLADRAEWDNYYIDNYSFWLDVKIVARTVIEALRPAKSVE